MNELLSQRPAAAPLPLAPLQLCCLQVIVEWLETYGYGPSYDDICHELDVSPRGSTITRLIGCLDAKGWIRRPRGRARRIEVLHKPPMPDFSTLDLVASAEILPPPLVRELAAAEAHYGPPGWAGVRHG